MTNSTKTWWQQGDVIIKPIKELPSGLKKIEGKVLQESEITGHHHHFAPTAKVEVYMEGEERQAGNSVSTITPNFGKYIVVEEPAQLFHGKGFEEMPEKTNSGDHHALKIPAGVYEIDIVREYDYDLEETGRVVD